MASNVIKATLPHTYIRVCILDEINNQYCASLVVSVPDLYTLSFKSILVAHITCIPYQQQ